MNDDDRGQLFRAARSEMYQLLLTSYCYKRKFDALAGRLRNESRYFLLEEMSALRHLSNGVILHLCNLDGDSGEAALRVVKKELAKLSSERLVVDKSGAKLKVFRANINLLKTKHRNEFIAHRNSHAYPNQLDLPDYQDDFREAIIEVLHILEFMWGGEIGFGFKLGSIEPFLDFKKELDLS